LPLRILLIEDENDNALIIQALLRRESAAIAVEWKETLADGLATLQSQEFDLVMLDLNLPDSNGEATFQQALLYTDNVALIIITSNDNETWARLAVQQGAQDYLLKSEINQRMLWRAVNYAIERKRVHRSLQESRDRLEILVQERTAALQVALAQSRLLTTRLVSVQENERRHLSRELHDEVGQTQIVLELGVQMREISHTLRPSLLDDLGLLPTLLSHFKRYTERTGIKVFFHHSNLEGRRFLPDLETTAYRLIQESLTNVVRHSDSSEVNVDVGLDGEVLSLQIADTGKGFDPATKQDGASNGLRGMRERVAMLNGKLRIDSGPNAGTIITALLPIVLAEDPAAEAA
jgi:signal transduction histidine kinase